MAEGVKTQQYLALLSGGLPEALDLGRNASTTSTNPQQFNERQAPTDTQARSVQSPARLSITSPAVLGSVALGLVGLLVVMRMVK